MIIIHTILYKSKKKKCTSFYYIFLPLLIYSWNNTKSLFHLHDENFHHPRSTKTFFICLHALGGKLVFFSLYVRFEYTSNARRRLFRRVSERNALAPRINPDYPSGQTMGTSVQQLVKPAIRSNIHRTNLISSTTPAIRSTTSTKHLHTFIYAHRTYVCTHLVSFFHVNSSGNVN